MPKQPNVTEAQLVEVVDQAQDVQADAYDYAERIGRGYHDDIAEPIAKARSLQAAARSILELSSVLLMRAALDEQKAQLEALLRAQAG